MYLRMPLMRLTRDAVAKKSEYIQEGIMFKVLWAEASCTSEPEILKRVEEIAAGEVRGTVKDDIPDSELLWHHQFGNLTSAVREVLGDFHPAGVRMILCYAQSLHAPQCPHLRANSQAPAVSQVTRDIHILP